MEQSEIAPLLSRRVVLCGTGCAAGLALLAACGGGGTSDQPLGDSGTSADPAPSDGSLADAAKVPVGGAISAKDSSGKPLIISQPKSGEFVAFSAICTHQGCTVAPGGDELKCPCHGSTYDLATGKNTGGPAPRPLSEVKIAVKNGKIVEA